MRMVAKRMREKAEELEEAKLDVRKEDKAIRPFTIPFQEGLVGEIAHITSFTTIQKHKSIERKAKLHSANIRTFCWQAPTA